MSTLRRFLKIILIGPAVIRFLSLEKKITSLLIDNNDTRVDFYTEEQINADFCSIAKRDSISEHLYKSIYIVDDFENRTYDFLKQQNVRILGLPCLLYIIDHSILLHTFTFNNVYSLTLFKAIIVFSGFEHERKAELSRLTKLAHFMGARVKLEVNRSVTHLIACDVKSSFYQDAVGLGMDVLNLDWLNYCWSHRQITKFDGTHREITANFRIKAFTGLCLAFHGFSPSALKEMIEIAIANGAIVSDVTNASITYLVINDKESIESLQYIKRYHVFLELLSTEQNYIDIMFAFIRIFRDGIEASLNDKLGPLMNKEEIKIVFGAIPDIIKIHEVIGIDLKNVVDKWNEKTELGNIFDKHVESMQKAYPAFINYYEIIKQTIEQNEAKNMRFNAFLKIAQTNPACNRQTLVELLIRPVQRLPSIILLLKELLKQTPEDSNDRYNIPSTIDNITFVLNQINEDKRRTNEQLQMVEIFNNIEDCPPTLMSSSRTLILRSEAYEFKDFKKYKSNIITLFILSDSIEALFARKRQNRQYRPLPLTMANVKSSPKTVNLTRNKSFKHCYYVKYSAIEHVVQVSDNSHPAYKNSFGLSMQLANQSEPTTYFYQLIGDRAHENLETVNTILSKSVTCAKTNFDVSNIKRSDSSSLFKQPDSPMSSLGKVIENLAIKASRRMSRAFSISNNFNGLPRSISVTSQLTGDSNQSSHLYAYDSRKSIHGEYVTQSADFENIPLFNPSKNNSKEKKSGIKSKTRKAISLWRRSIQSTDLKR
ncbi:hypothetical protein HZS_6425 [Henneguya salminicola]|nr:hypothetical protein HZS_6425 [Henneguya salminicola]